MNLIVAAVLGVLAAAVLVWLVVECRRYWRAVRRLNAVAAGARLPAGG